MKTENIRDTDNAMHIPYRFDIENSKKLIIDLDVHPSFRAKSVHFQIHEMNDGSYQLFWKHGLMTNELIKHAIEYTKFIGIDRKDIKFHTLIESKEFSDFIAPYTNSGSIVLNYLETNLVNNILNTEYDKNVKMWHGLDGWTYDLKIYGNKTHSLNCWFCFPKEWKYVDDLKEMLFSYIDPAVRERYFGKKNIFLVYE